jgi:hypothetical protein
MKTLRVIAVALLVASFVQAQSAKPGMGVEKVPQAIAATNTSARPNTLKPMAGAPLPPVVDLGESLPPVRSQGQVGSCSAWSTVYYARTLLEQRQRLWNPTETNHQFAPLYTYNQLTQGKNQGTAITEHMRLMKEQGIVPLADFPYTDRLDIQPDEQLQQRATSIRIESYKSIPRKDGCIDLDAVKSFLAQGYPVICGFSLFEDFDDYRGGLYSTTSGTPSGGHAMAIIGYDDVKQALHIVNSWDTWWGEKGYLWLSYESAKAMTKTNYGCAVMFPAPVPKKIPDAPHDLAASKGEAEDSINLSWSAIPDADRYLVFRADNTSREWTVLASATDPAYVDGNLPPGVTYVYAVQALKTNPSGTLSSPLSPVAEGWTQSRASPPGIVQGLEGLLYRDSVILAWNKLADTDQYQIYRFKAADSTFELVGSSKDTVFRDDDAFSSGESATYFVQGTNANGNGLPSDNMVVNRSTTPSKASPEAAKLAQKNNDDKIAPAPSRKAYAGSYYEANFFDPKYIDKAFKEYAAKEKAAYAAWLAKDQADFNAFLTENLK